MTPKHRQAMVGLEAAIFLAHAMYKTNLRSAIANQRPLAEPKVGELVIETTIEVLDLDSLGYLVGHDQAPFGVDDPLDGTVPMRGVWDIKPLNPDARVQTIAGEKVQRWENAIFHALTADQTNTILRFLGMTT
jgi:hypothetical protein